MNLSLIFPLSCWRWVSRVIVCLLLVCAILVQPEQVVGLDRFVLFVRFVPFPFLILCKCFWRGPVCECRWSFVISNLPGCEFLPLFFACAYLLLRLFFWRWFSRPRSSAHASKISPATLFLCVACVWLLFPAAVTLFVFGPLERVDESFFRSFFSP